MPAPFKPYIVPRMSAISEKPGMEDSQYGSVIVNNKVSAASLGLVNARDFDSVLTSEDKMNIGVILGTNDRLST